jgi:Fic family protein
MAFLDIEGTPYSYDDSRSQIFSGLASRVKTMRAGGSLSNEVLYRIRKHFRIKSIYHSNAIEGNVLEAGETRQVVELGLTITGKPLKDQAEARNLSHALDFLEDLAANPGAPITESDIRQVHAFVLSGLSDQAGSYRSVPVAISGSSFSPPGPESVRAEMTEFGRWLSSISISTDDTFAGVRGLLAAAAAHTWFVTIHPFIDGNGRVARLLMNLTLMRYGYPIAIISKEDRLRYYDTLETSQSSDLTPFVGLLVECIEESLEEYEAAAKEQIEQRHWAQSLANEFTQPERVRSENEYEVWRNAMELLKSYFRQTVSLIDQAVDYGGVFFKDFGGLEFEKYSVLRQGASAKRTWFLRVDFRRGETAARYLLFFGHASHKMRKRCSVTLHVAREEPPNSYFYQRHEELADTRGPDLVEIGYDMPRERFVVRPRGGLPRMRNVEDFTKEFLEAIVRTHFGG